jgi:hypothetical protein
MWRRVAGDVEGGWLGMWRRVAGDVVAGDVEEGGWGCVAGGVVQVLVSFCSKNYDCCRHDYSKACSCSFLWRKIERFFVVVLVVL